MSNQTKIGRVHNEPKGTVPETDAFEQEIGVVYNESIRRAENATAARVVGVVNHALAAPRRTLKTRTQIIGRVNNELQNSARSSQ